MEDANGGWANEQGYTVELDMGDGQRMEIDVEALSGFAALPFHISPLPAAFFAAAPPPAPALPADLAGAAAAINHGLDEYMDYEVLFGLDGVPFYVPMGYVASLPPSLRDACLTAPPPALHVAALPPAIPADDVADPPPALPAADVTDPAIMDGFAALPFNASDLPDDFLNTKSGVCRNPWDEIASLKFALDEDRAS